MGSSAWSIFFLGKRPRLPVSFYIAKCYCKKNLRPQVKLRILRKSPNIFNCITSDAQTNVIFATELLKKNI